MFDVDTTHDISAPSKGISDQAHAGIFGGGSRKDAHFPGDATPAILIGKGNSRTGRVGRPDQGAIRTEHIDQGVDHGCRIALNPAEGAEGVMDFDHRAAHHPKMLQAADNIVIRD
jgi:hypothetical protein